MHIRQGIDIVSTERIRQVCARHSGFVEEVFSEGERASCMKRRDPYAHLAGRFAAKEACLKALGRGLRATAIDAALGEIEVVERPSGKPELRLSGFVRSLADRMGVEDAAVSISHDGGYAVSHVILYAGKDVD